MHVALIVSDLGGGGVERVVLNLAGGLIDRGHRVDVVLFRTRVHYPVPEKARLFVMDNGRGKPAETVDPEAHTRRIPLIAPSNPSDWAIMTGVLNWDRLCLFNARLLRQARALASYMESERPDCVLPSASSPKEVIPVVLLACRLSAPHPPVIPIVHSFVKYRRYRYRRRYRRLFETAARLVGVSQGVADSLAAIIGVSGKSITTLCNPVIAPDVHVRMAELPDHPWLLDDGAPVILSAGRLTRSKDFSTLVRAFARLSSSRPCRLVILGEGKDRVRLERLVRRLGLSDQVSLPGWVENPLAFMSRASLFALASRREGSSMVLVEALACGCPCVSTDCPAGPAEVLQNGKFGPLVPVGDEAALAEAMGRVLDQPPNRRMLQQRAAAFSVESAVSDYEKLIQGHASGHGGPSMPHLASTP